MMKVRTVFCRLGILVFAFGLIIGSGRLWNAHKYPFGRSHCCDKALMFALMAYADAHNGAFPSGEATPEASLSLLFKAKLADANLLRGKSVAEATVAGILNGGKLLGPESCGWHYVEGLHKDDDPRLAIFWDKEGLDHNGGRLANGGHIVWYLNFDHPHISASEWSKFLAEQEGLHKERLKKQTKSGS